MYHMHHRTQKSTSNPREPELKVTVSHHVDAGSCPRASSAPNKWTTSAASRRLTLTSSHCRQWAARAPKEWTTSAASQRLILTSSPCRQLCSEQPSLSVCLNTKFRDFSSCRLKPERTKFRVPPNRHVSVQKQREGKVPKVRGGSRELSIRNKVEKFEVQFLKLVFKDPIQEH